MNDLAKRLLPAWQKWRKSVGIPEREAGTERAAFFAGAAALEQGEPVAFVTVGFAEHGPFTFQETAYGVDHLSNGKHALYTHPQNSTAQEARSFIDADPGDVERAIERAKGSTGQGEGALTGQVAPANHANAVPECAREPAPVEPEVGELVEQNRTKT